MSASTSSESISLLNGSGDPEIWDVNYVNEDHIQSFAQALSISDTQAIEGELLSPTSPRSPPPPIPADGTDKSSPPMPWKLNPDNGGFPGGAETRRGRVEKLTATSDFAPIHQRVSRKRSRTTQQGWTYHLIRWPLLSFIFLIISLEFGAYVLTRQVVNVFEWLVAWRGHKRNLRRRLRDAKTYEEWKTAAKELDDYLGFDEWKETEEDSYFDYALVKRVRRTLIRLRAAKDSRGLMDALAVCVRSNFAGSESVKMYSETFFGTKKIVELHINEVAASLDFVRTATDVSLEEKRAFFRAVNKNYGSSALCLSGGAGFAYYHFGVVKAFLEADLLPRVVTGTSAGGLVAALLCTRTDAELKRLLVPQLADKITACEESMRVWFRRFMETGARFSTLEWARKAMFFTYGSLTFKEAYERTGRAFNVSVVPSDRHSPTILLNYLTAPNCLMWSAIIASAAVPGILNPVVLMAKDRTGEVQPHNLGGSRFKDGSLREDIPLGSLHTQFNCNFSIVSQTNPHIHLFFFAPRGSVGRPVAHRKGKGWRGGFILSALESYIKLDLSKHFKVIRDLDLLPQILQSDWSGVFLQRFSGDLTLTPRSTVGDWFRLLSDPNRSQLARMLEVGERVSWPALRMVRNRLTIERAILRGRTEIRSALHRDRTTTDIGSPPRAPDSRPPSPCAHVPIESDADAGFISRTRRARGSRSGLSAGEIFGQSSTEARRRRGAPRPKKSNSDLLPVALEQSAREYASSPPKPAPFYTSALNDTFRHVRAASVTAFSPFRSMRSTPRPERPPERRRSQLSITRWFGGASSTDSEDEDDDVDAPRLDTTLSGDETPSFPVDDGDESVEVDDGAESEEKVLLPSGRRVSETPEDAGGGSAGVLTPDRRDTHYSPPQQDGI